MTQFLIEHSFLFTNEERELIYRAASDVNTRPVSMVTRLLFPLWNFISVHFLSYQVAPNAITLVGLMSCLQAYQLINTYYHYGEPAQGLQDVLSSINSYGVRGAGQTPLGYSTAEAWPGGRVDATLQRQTATTAKRASSTYTHFHSADATVQMATVLSGLLLIVSIACGSLGGVHAKRCRSATSLGDIFSSVCASMTRIVMALTMLELMEITDIATKWYVLLTLQLIEFNTVLSRINAENLKKAGVKNLAYHLTYLFRDSELSFLMLVVLVVRWGFPETAALLDRVPPEAARYGYAILVVFSVLNTALMKMKKRYKSSIALCLAARVAPIFYLLPLSKYNTLSIFGDTIVVGLLSIEVYVSHRARRRIHAAVIFICLGSLLNDVLAVVASVLYIVGILVDLSYALNVPIFVPICNVFIDGVFDLCHAGHKKLMERALRFGNRLVVGVCGDEECASYKRRPIMTIEERVNEVRLCKYVSEVIPNSPVSGITAEMIMYYNIHIVVCGEEYDVPGDTYYAVPRRMGILRTVPRTQGISTSALIRRIRAADNLTKDGSHVAAVDSRDGSHGTESR